MWKILLIHIRRGARDFYIGVHNMDIDIYMRRQHGSEKYA